MHIISDRIPLRNEYHSYLLGYILCPVHSEKTPSCAIYTTQSTERVRLYCYGCGHSDFKDKHEIMGQLALSSIAAQGKHPIYRPRTIQSYSDAARTFFAERGVAPYLADRYGIRQVSGNDNAIYIPAYNFIGEECGGEVRFCVPMAGRKMYRVKGLKANDYPDHSWILLAGREVPDMLYITESVMDGLSIIQRNRHMTTSIGGLALLGTHVPMWMYRFLNDKMKDQLIVVWLDDDDAGKSMSLHITANLHMMGMRVTEIRNGKPYKPTR